MDNILLSVIIPCYNNGQYLIKMLDCCKRQSFSSWEVIIVDDGSTDDTPIVIRNYIKGETRFTFYQRDRNPKGSVVCRNIGFSLSHGKYVMHFDADDLISESCFEKRVKFMENNPDLDYASFPAKAFSDENNLPDFDTPGHTYGVLNGTGDLLYDFLNVNYDFSVWNNIYKKSSIVSIKWDEKVKIYTDFSFIIPCILNNLKHAFSKISEIDYYYRVSDNRKDNMCSDFVSEEKTESTIYLFEKTLKSLKDFSNSSKYKKAFFSFMLYHFEKILTGGTYKNQKQFIQFVSKHYNSKYRMLIIYHFFKSASIQNYKIRKGILYVMFFLFWGKKKYLNIIIEHI